MIEEKQREEMKSSIRESHSTNHLVKILVGITVSNFAVFVFGGTSVWVNDGNQDKELQEHQERISYIEQTRYKASDEERLLQLIDAEHDALSSRIDVNAATASEIKQILIRLEDKLDKMK